MLALPYLLTALKGIYCVAWRCIPAQRRIGGLLDVTQIHWQIFFCSYIFLGPKYHPITSKYGLPLVWLAVIITLVATKNAPFSAGGTT